METASRALRHAQRWDTLVVELERVWQDNNVALVCFLCCRPPVRWYVVCIVDHLYAVNDHNVLVVHAGVV